MWNYPRNPWGGFHSNPFRVGATEIWACPTSLRPGLPGSQNTLLQSPPCPASKPFPELMALTGKTETLESGRGSQSLYWAHDQAQSQWGWKRKGGSEALYKRCNLPRPPCRVAEREDWLIHLFHVYLLNTRLAPHWVLICSSKQERHKPLPSWSLHSTE